MKRKMYQVNTIRNKLTQSERYSNNLDNRVEFINLSKSIFANLMSVVGSQQYQQFQSYNITNNIDQLSNMWSSSSNNITQQQQQDTTLYEKVGGETFQDGSTIDLGTFSNLDDLEPVDTSTQKNYLLQMNSGVMTSSRTRKKERGRWDKDREERFNQKCTLICRNLCIGISLMGLLIIVAVVGLKYIM